MQCNSSSSWKLRACSSKPLACTRRRTTGGHEGGRLPDEARLYLYKTALKVCLSRSLYLLAANYEDATPWRITLNEAYGRRQCTGKFSQNELPLK